MYVGVDSIRILGKVKSRSKKMRHVQKLVISEKVHIFCPIIMKLGENNHHFHKVS